MTTDIIGKHITLKGYTNLYNAVDRLEKKSISIIRKVWREEARVHVTPTVRRNVKRQLGGSGKLARSYIARVSGKGKSVVMELYSRVAATIPHELGPKAPIIAKKSKYLTIPTDFARLGSATRGGMRALKKQKRHLSLRMLINSAKRGERKLVVKNLKSGKGKVVFEKMIKDTPIRRYVKGVKGKFFEGELVPMFILVKRVSLRKRTDVVNFMVKYSHRLGKKTLDAIEQEYMKDA